MTNTAGGPAGGGKEEADAEEDPAGPAVTEWGREGKSKREPTVTKPMLHFAPSTINGW